MYAPLIISSSSQNTKGVGTYLASQWVTPQRYKSPLGGAVVEVPSGWGTGLSGCGCGGTCGGCGDKHGLGTVFDSTDLSDWGIGEWSVLGMGLVVTYLLFRGGSKASTAIKKSRRKRARRAKAREKARQALLSL